MADVTGSGPRPSPLARLLARALSKLAQAVATMNSKGPEPLPRTVAWLGYGGLLPFVALAIASVVAHLSGQNPGVWRVALLAYGAVILSFVGALRWGFAMTLRGLTPAQRTACFVWSVVPALVAWVACVALLVPVAAPARSSTDVAAALLVAGFCVHYARDRSLAAHADLPAWYLPMRLRLTWVACLCLILSGAVAGLHSFVAG